MKCRGCDKSIIEGRKFCGLPCYRKYLSNTFPGKGKNHPGWKGDDVGYWGLHDWVQDRLGRGYSCSQCGSSKKIELANLDHKYTRDLSQWTHLCYRCHRKYDMRMGWGDASAMFDEVRNRDSRGLPLRR